MWTAGIVRTEALTSGCLNATSTLLRYREVYLFDNQAQMLLAIEDYDYTLWLTGKPCYIRDVVKAPTHSCLS